jgi:glucosyl-3-phosphoglycerate synthase
MLGLDVRPLVDLARSMSGRPVLLGLVRVPMGKPLSRGASMARQLRRTLVHMGMEAGEPRAAHTFVSHRPWKELEQLLLGDPTALLLLEHPGHFLAMDADVAEVLARPPCNLAILRGPLPAHPLRVLVPMRGGPYAELALRVAFSLPHERLQVLHITPPEGNGVADSSFAGLARILPRLPEVQVHSAASAQPLQLIREWAEQAHLVVMCASAQPAQAQPGIGPLAESILRDYPGAAVIVKTRVEEDAPREFTGVRAGTRAISVLVDKWFAENTFHASEFDDLGLLDLKRARGLSINRRPRSTSTVGRVLGTCARR